MVTVWGRKNSINVHKVLWCLDELGERFERRDAGMAFGVVDTPEYLEMNPNGRVPTLVDGDLTLWESNTIVRYLAASRGALAASRGASLISADAGARAVAEQWMDWQQTTLLPDMTTVFWAKVRGRETPADVVAAAEQGLAKSWGMVEAALGDDDYLGGASLGVADIAIGVCAWRWYAMDTVHPSFPAVERWHGRLKARPAFVEHVAHALT